MSEIQINPYQTTPRQAIAESVEKQVLAGIGQVAVDLGVDFSGIMPEDQSREDDTVIGVAVYHPEDTVIVERVQPKQISAQTRSMPASADTISDAMRDGVAAILQAAQSTPYSERK